MEGKTIFFEAPEIVVGRNASEEVLFALIKSKCLPILLHVAWPTNSAVYNEQSTF